MVTDIRGRRWLWIVALSAIMAALFVSPATPASAEPGENGNTAAALREQLEAANRGYLDAQTTLNNSRARQAELDRKIADLQLKLDDARVAAKELAVMAYRNNGMRTASALLASASPDNFMDRMTALNTMASRNDRQLREFKRLNGELAATKTSLDAEIKLQEQQLAEMAKRKAAAEKAVGGTQTTGYGGGKSPTAQPAPKVNGKWPSESCSQDDPTTSGCLTPRTLHAYKQTKAAGFDHYVACYRSAQDGGQHPQGRACDWAAQKSGFGGVATGADRDYGNRLAQFYISNADALAVLYVIWFQRIWQASTGWRTYNSGNGDPASEHQNHVHLSVY
jgi:peptidoglycan DL-endopeptidase CwlO